jgi:hypothetical protein
MKPVNQKVISPTAGDCFDACMVSILELDEAPEWAERTSQYIRWNQWLAAKNMQLVYYASGSHPAPAGYFVLSVNSAVFVGKKHAVVGRGGAWTSDTWITEVVHNPNPQDPRGVNIPVEDWIGFSVIALVDPAKDYGRCAG